MDINQEKLTQNTNKIIDLLKTVKELMSDGYVKYVDYSDTYQVANSSYTLGKFIHELEKGLIVLNKQMSCEHKNTTGLIFAGNDSHYKYYHNKCKDCGFTVETYQI